MSDPSTLWALLRCRTEKFPSKTLTFLDRGLSGPAAVFTYSELLEKSKANACLLRQHGVVAPGDIVLIYFDSHWENILWFWSITAAGGIPAVVPQLLGDLNAQYWQVQNLETIFDGRNVLTNKDGVHPFTKARNMRICLVEQISDVDQARESLCNTFDDTITHPGDLAALLFTSGSTGNAKAVEYCHSHLLASVRAKSEFHKVSPDTVFLSWASLDHSANLCEIHLNAIYAGSDHVYVRASDLAYRPDEFFRLLSIYQIGYTFAPNSFLAAATAAFKSRSTAQYLDFSHLQVLMCGGEASKTSTLMSTHNLLRDFGGRENAIKPAYGLSETCSACFYNLQFPGYDLCKRSTFTSVGIALPKVLEFRVVSSSQHENVTGVPGAIHIRGDILFREYHKSEDASKMCRTADGWFDTGDIGVLDESGQLSIAGRSKELIIINGINYSPFEIEYAIEKNGIDGLEISYTACFATRRENSQSEGVVVVYHPRTNATESVILQSVSHAIVQAVISFCGAAPLEVLALPKGQLPKSTIGKLSRMKLKQAYESGAFDCYRNSSGTKMTPAEQRATFERLSPIGKTIAKAVAEQVDKSPDVVAAVDNLASMGLDSLGYIRLKASLTTALGLTRELPLSLLVQCPSIMLLQEAVSDLGDSPTEYDPIVCLSDSGSELPLFLLHPGGGDVTCWIHLRDHLPNRPLYALKARGLCNDEVPFQDVGELLNCYYKAIRRIQPQGPYNLLGYCFGGILVFELAQKLESAKEQVKFSGLIDTPPVLATGDERVRHRLQVIHTLFAATSRPLDLASQFADKTEDLSDHDFFQFLGQEFTPGLMHDLDITPDQLLATGQVEKGLRSIAMSYTPAGTVSRLDIFCSDPASEANISPWAWRADRLRQWEKHSSDVAFHEVDGMHFTVMSKEHIDSFKNILNHAISTRGG